jgi:hypothetical protein
MKKTKHFNVLESNGDLRKSLIVIVTWDLNIMCINRVTEANRCEKE